MKTISSNINKEGTFKDDDLVCYCFQYKRKDIELDVKNNGYSKILKKIIAEKNPTAAIAEKKIPKAGDAFLMFTRW
jgi:hypothetical protein